MGNATGENSKIRPISTVRFSSLEKISLGESKQLRFATLENVLVFEFPPLNDKVDGGGGYPQLLKTVRKFSNITHGVAFPKGKPQVKNCKKH